MQKLLLMIDRIIKVSATMNQENTWPTKVLIRSIVRSNFCMLSLA